MKNVDTYFFSSRQYFFKCYAVFALLVRIYFVKKWEKSLDGSSFLIGQKWVKRMATTACYVSWSVFILYNTCSDCYMRHFPPGSPV